MEPGGCVEEYIECFEFTQNCTIFAWRRPTPSEPKYIITYSKNKNNEQGHKKKLLLINFMLRSHEYFIKNILKYLL